MAFIASSVSLGVFCLGADHAIFTWEERWSQLPQGQALRAVSDSVVHGVVGGWSWGNVLLATQGEFDTTKLLQVVICVAMATGMDLDHMIEARSFSIKVRKGDSWPHVLE